MINEKEILRQEEIDFRGVINRFKRGWPIIALALGFWLIIGIIFQLTFPPQFTAKTTILIDKPKGINDPGVMVSRMPNGLTPDDYYYNNQKVAFRSVPLIKEAIRSVGEICYVKAGLFDVELYKNAPFSIELDSTYMNFKKHETPYGATFYIEFENFEKYTLEAEGEYGVTKAEFEFEGEFQFGEWVTFDQTRFRVLAADTLSNTDITLQYDIFEETFGFIVKDIDAVALEYIGSMEIEQEELESTAFMVSIYGSAPKKKLAFLNALNEAFIKDHLDQKTKALRLAIEYLDAEIEETSLLLRDSESAIETFKTEEAITSLTHEGTLLMNQSVTLENDKVGFIVKDRYYKYLENYLKQSDDYSTLISPQAFGVKDELINRLTEELVSLQQDLNSLEKQNAQANPAYAQVKARIAQNRQTILNSVEGFKQSNQMMIENLDGRINELDQTVKSLPKAQRELLQLERFFKINETLYVTFLDKKAEAEINLVSTAADFRIIEPAYLTSLEPSIPWLPLTIIAAIILGFLFGFGYLFFVWLTNNKLDTARGVYQYNPSTELLGEVYHSNINSPSELQSYPDSQLANQLSAIFYRMIRQNPGAKLVAFSSIKSGEGKTFMASMAATQTARLGYKTLVVDLNFRQPELKRSFGLSQGANLNDAMMGHVNLKEALVTTTIKNLDVAELGIKSTMSDMEVQAILEIIRTLQEQYDYIYLDTAPFGNVSATMSFLNASDMPVVVVRRKHTTLQNLEDIQLLVEQNSIAATYTVVVDTFPTEVQILNFKRKRKNYYQNKQVGVFTKVKNLFARI